MLDRFGDQGLAVVACAEEEARRLGHHHIGTEHLVLGLLGASGSSAAQLLRSAGATLDGCRSRVAELVGPPGRIDDDAELDLTDRARRVLMRADRLSLRLRRSHVEPEHILVSLLDVEGTAGQVLRGVSVDVADLRVAASSLLNRTARPVPSVHAGDPVERAEPRCASCGATVGDAVSARILPSEQLEGEHRPIIVIYCGSCGSVFGASPR